jgi:hypothetical protein
MASQMSSQVQGGIQPRQRAAYPQKSTTLRHKNAIVDRKMRYAGPSESGLPSSLDCRNRLVRHADSGRQTDPWVPVSCSMSAIPRMHTRTKQQVRTKWGRFSVAARFRLRKRSAVSCFLFLFHFSPCFICCCRARSLRVNFKQCRAQKVRSPLFFSRAHCLTYTTWCMPARGSY